MSVGDIEKMAVLGVASKSDHPLEVRARYHPLQSRTDQRHNWR
jgi:hypothetical protein